MNLTKSKSPFKYEKPDNSFNLWAYASVMICIIYGLYLFAFNFAEHDAIKFGYFMNIWHNQYFNIDDATNHFFSTITPHGIKLLYYISIKMGLSVMQSFQIGGIIASGILGLFIYKICHELSGKNFISFLSVIVVMLFLSLDGSVFSGTPKNWGYLFLSMWFYFLIKNKFALVSLTSLTLPLFYPFFGVLLIPTTIIHALSIKDKRLCFSGRIAPKYILSILSAFFLSLSLFISEVSKTVQVRYSTNIDIYGFNEANNNITSGHILDKLFLNPLVSFNSQFPLFGNSYSSNILSAIFCIILIAMFFFICIKKSRLISPQSRIFATTSSVAIFLYLFALFNLFQFYLPSAYTTPVIRLIAPIFIIIYIGRNTELKASLIKISVGIILGAGALIGAFNIKSSQYYIKATPNPIVDYIKLTHPQSTVAGLGDELNIIALTTSRNLYYTPEFFISFDPTILGISMNRMKYINEGIYSSKDISKLLILINASASNFILVPKTKYSTGNKFLDNLGIKNELSPLLGSNIECIKAESKNSILLSSNCISKDINSVMNPRNQP